MNNLPRNISKYHQIKVSTGTKHHNAVRREPNEDYLRGCAEYIYQLRRENQHWPMEQDESEHMVPRVPQNSLKW